MKYSLVLLAALMALPVNVRADATPQMDQAWNFNVYLGDKQIGYHRFQATDLDNGLLVRSDAEFQVKVLFVTAFDYEHSNSEVWRNGCLQSLDATTNSNGKKSEVLGRLEGGTFVVESGSQSQAVDECVASFAYWDRKLLEREQLLNAQTGEYLNIETKALPAQRLKIAQQEILVEQVHLAAKDVDIVVSYAAGTGAWVALDSTLKNGRTLSYRRSDPAVSASRAMAMNDRGKPDVENQ